MKEYIKIGITALYFLFLIGFRIDKRELTEAQMLFDYWYLYAILIVLVILMNINLKTK